MDSEKLKIIVESIVNDKNPEPLIASIMELLKHENSRVVYVKLLDIEAIYYDVKSDQSYIYYDIYILTDKYVVEITIAHANNEYILWSVLLKPLASNTIEYYCEEVE